jgi:hypothetical protein
MRPERSARAKPLTSELRWGLRVAAFLVLIAGIQLFVFAEQTDRWFAWTINPPLTAAFLGAAYWATFFISMLASTKRTWARMRAVVPTVLTFSTLTLIVTLLHFDRFHFDSDQGSAVFAAWAWLAVYVLVPPAGLLLLFRQMRVPGGDPAPGAPLPAWLRAVLALQGTLMFVLGVALFVAPLDVAPRFWPWALSELTGRAVAAWLLATAVHAALVIRENDTHNVQPGTVTYLALGVLQLVALARYATADLPGTTTSLIDWGSAVAWVYTAFIVSIFLVGLYMTVALRHAPARDSVSDVSPAAPAP